MQFDRAEKDAPLVPLPAPSIDTGMGLERIACAVQGVTSNYDTDLLRGLVDKAADLAKKRYTGSTSDDDVSMRVIADHARTTAFLMAEGIMPERNKREYILRRVMRRAIRHGQRLGIDRPFLHEVALEVIERMGATYPELVERKELITRVTEDEEVRFRITLKRGLAILDDHFSTLRQRSERTLTAEIAADLYSTYGFPLDLTEVICREGGFTVDADAASQIVKGAGGDGPINPDEALDPVYHLLKQDLPPVEFTGYDREDGASEIVALVRVSPGPTPGSERRDRVTTVAAGDVVELVTKVTPFYAESGGQVGDQGTVTAGAAKIRVTDTQRPLQGLIVLRGTVEAGSFSVGDAVEQRVDPELRTATRRNHSATHLLHWALKVVLGEHAMQKGSRVGPDILRFDFAHNRPLSEEEIVRIEDLVNAKILENAPVLTSVLPIDEAKKQGAVAIFEEKYGDVVRMLTMTKDSVELCGGTHARALGDLGYFRIDSDASVAAGVRRVFASTGKNAIRAVRKTESELAKLERLLKVQGDALADRVAKILQSEKDLSKKVAELERKLLEGGGGGGGIDGMLASAVTVDGIRCLALRLPNGTASGALRELGEKLRDKLGEESAVLLASQVDDKAAFCVMVSKAATAKVAAGNLAREIAKMLGGNGGGRPDMAQGGGTQIGELDHAVASFVGEVQKLRAS
jgi:alanyl-tRNA synthetase